MATAVAHRVTALLCLSIVVFVGGAILLWWSLARIREARRLARSLSNVLQGRANSTQGILDLALNEAIGLTRSGIGYFYFHHLDRQELLLRSWSREVAQESTGADPAGPFDPSMTTGILNDVTHTRRPVILNDFQASHPFMRGYPDGHAALRRVLALPVFSGDRIVAVVAVANKSRAYDAADVERLRLVMDAAWKDVEQRTATEALADSEARFRRLVLDAPFPVMLHAEDGAILQVSRSWCDITGYAREELATMADWTARAYGE